MISKANIQQWLIDGQKAGKYPATSCRPATLLSTSCNKRGSNPGRIISRYFSAMTSSSKASWKGCAGTGNFTGLWMTD